MTRGFPKLLALAALAAAWSSPGRAQSAGQWHGPDQIYATICANCHDTGVGPVLKGSQVPADHVRMVVRHGQNGMPAFRPSEFSDAELAALATWLGTAPPEAKP